MTRQNLFADSPWDGEDAETGTLHRIFWRPDDARMGATLWELRPGAPALRRRGDVLRRQRPAGLPQPGR
jgi:hypothetical protein